MSFVDAMMLGALTGLGGLTLIVLLAALLAMPLKDRQSAPMRKTMAQVNAEERQRSEEAFRSARKMILWFCLGLLVMFLFGCAAHPQPVLTHWNCVNSPPYSYVECLPLEVLK